jgi:dTDP-4-dehydrorhamnose 3,5-epimerase
MDGLIIKELKWFGDDRGRLMEIMKCTDEFFRGFGQVHISTVRPGIVKAWHVHHRQDELFAVILGSIRMGFYDQREGSKTFGRTMEYILSADKPVAIQVPRGVYHGFECVGEQEAFVLNVPSMPYDRANPDEVRSDPFQNNIPFKWNATKGR